MRWSFLSLFLALLTTVGCSTTSSSNKSLVYLVKVEKGDTLSKIASKYDTSWRKIITMNKFEGNRALKIGQVLRISPGPAGIVANVKHTDLPNIPAMDDKTFKSHTSANNTKSKSKRREGLFFGGKKTATIDWPVKGRITSKYGRRWGRMHRGVDIASPRGHSVLSAKEGVVTFVGNKRGYGKTIVVTHKYRETLYAHLSKILVNNGDKISAGHAIGKIGTTGNSRGPHLHFEVRDLNGKSIDPLQFLPEEKLLASRHH